MSKLTFNVSFSSGEDAEYPAKELNTHSPHTRGWQSPRFCEYPQEVGLSLVNPARLTQVQLLSHQSKISTKIELFVGVGASYDTATWKRLGYLSLDDNSRSDYQARELKSVYIDCTGGFLKLLVHKNYVNKHNIFNQVGIVAVNLLGEYTGVSGGGGDGGAAGGGKPGPMDELSFDMNLDPESAQRIRHIVAAKERAVEMEDYDAAKRLKAAEGELCGLGVRLAQLEVAKRASVSGEDYDRAKALKLEINGLRNQISSTLAEIEASLGADIMHGRQHQQQQQQYGGGYGNHGADDRPIGGGPGPQGQHGPSGYGGGPGGGMNGPQGDGGGYPPDGADSHHNQHNQYNGYNADPYPQQTPGGYDNNNYGGENGGGNPGNNPYDTPGAGGGGMGDGGHPRTGGSGGVRHSNDNPMANNTIANDDPYGNNNNNNDPYGGSGGCGDDPYGNGGPPNGVSPSGGGGGAGGCGGGGPGYDESGGSGGGGGEEGPHPLEGVPNCYDLPLPDPLPVGALLGEGNDLAEVAKFCGEYVVRCLLSKAWALREAALVKVKISMPSLLTAAQEQAGGGNGAVALLVPALSKVLLMGAEDKLAQVYLASLSLLENCCGLFGQGTQGGGGRVPRGELQHRLEGVASILVLKLGDSQVRIREAAEEALLMIAGCQPLGCDFVARHAVKKLPQRQTGKVWRPLAARLDLLKNLVLEYGVSSSGGGGGEAHHALTVELAMGFVKETEATSHTSQDVRDAARQLAVSLYTRVLGQGVDWEPWLGMLRSKQREEYERAFEEAKAEAEGNGGGPSPAHGGGGKQKGKNARSPALAQHKHGGGAEAGYDEREAKQSPPPGRGRGRGKSSPSSDGRSNGPSPVGGRDDSTVAFAGGSATARTVTPRAEGKDDDDEEEDGLVPDEGAKGESAVGTVAYAESNEVVPGDEVMTGATSGGDEEEGDDTDVLVENFKDDIMKELEESAFSIEEARGILGRHFGVPPFGDTVKDAVLHEWCIEVGLTMPVAEMSVPERIDACDRVAKWLFQ